MRKRYHTFLSLNFLPSKFVLNPSKQFLMFLLNSYAPSNKLFGKDEINLDTDEAICLYQDYSPMV